METEVEEVHKSLILMRNGAKNHHFYLPQSCITYLCAHRLYVLYHTYYFTHNYRAHKMCNSGAVLAGPRTLAFSRITSYGKNMLQSSQIKQITLGLGLLELYIALQHLQFQHLL